MNCPAILRLGLILLASGCYETAFASGPAAHDPGDGSNPPTTTTRPSFTGDFACDPGETKCPDGCFDLSEDATRCGSCVDSCLHGQVCFAGACMASSVMEEVRHQVHADGSLPKISYDSEEPDSLFSEPQVVNDVINSGVQVLGGNWNQECFNNSEAVPERSANAAGAKLFVAYQKPGSPSGDGKANYATGAFNTWTTGELRPAVQGFPNWYAGGDPWAASGPASGQEYFAYILRGPNSERCLGVTATSATNLTLTPPVWSYPGTCVGPHRDIDGPAIVYDKEASGLYGVYTDRNPDFLQRKVFLVGMNPCNAGVPGQPGGCNLSAQWPSSPITVATGTYAHATVAVNSCPIDANHVVVAYRSSTSNQIRLAFYDAGNGSVVKNWLVRTGQQYQQNSQCTGTSCGANSGYIPQCTGPCGGDCTSAGNGCMIPNAKPHVYTKYNAEDQKCYAYVTYDFSCAATDGNTYMKSRFEVVDITNVGPNMGQDPVLVTSYGSANCKEIGNDWQATPNVNDLNSCKYVGWHWYRQANNNPCQTSVRLAVSNNYAVTSMIISSSISNLWPAVKFGGGANGFGHYIAGMRGGLADGTCGIFAVWSEPDGTSDTSCPQCQIFRRTVNLKGARAHP